MIRSVVHPTRFERATFCSASKRSIQLSYGCEEKYMSSACTGQIFRRARRRERSDATGAYGVDTATARVITSL